MIVNGLFVDVLDLWGRQPGVDLPGGIGSPLPTFLPKIVCPNPAHQTKKAHFQINTRQPTVHCFASCGISGGYERALAIVNGWYLGNGKPDVKKGRAEMLRSTRIPLKGDLPASPGTDGNRKTLDHESAVARDQRALEGGQYTYLPREARDYLTKRGVEDATRGRWQIGWDEETDRLVLPAYDARGTFRFLIRHRIDGGRAGKYLYTSGAIKTSLLYGACFAQQDELDSLGLALVEGPFDTISMQQAGVIPTGGILGSGLSEKQLKIIVHLRPRRLYLFFDRDAAGFGNVIRSLTMHQPAPLYVCRYPTHRFDPGEMEGGEIKTAVEEAIPMSQFIRKTRNLAPMKEALHNGTNHLGAKTSHV